MTVLEGVAADLRLLSSRLRANWHSCTTQLSDVELIERLLPEVTYLSVSVKATPRILLAVSNLAQAGAAQLTAASCHGNAAAAALKMQRCVLVNCSSRQSDQANILAPVADAAGCCRVLCVPVLTTEAAPVALQRAVGVLTLGWASDKEAQACCTRRAQAVAVVLSHLLGDWLEADAAPLAADFATYLLPSSMPPHWRAMACQPEGAGAAEEAEEEEEEQLGSSCRAAGGARDCRSGGGDGGSHAMPICTAAETAPAEEARRAALPLPAVAAIQNPPAPARAPDDLGANAQWEAQALQPDFCACKPQVLWQQPLALRFADPLVERGYCIWHAAHLTQGNIVGMAFFMVAVLLWLAQSSTLLHHLTASMATLMASAIVLPMLVVGILEGKARLLFARALAGGRFAVLS